MLYVLKLDYEYLAGAKTQTKLIVYEELTEAQRVFDHLELGYQFNQPIRVGGGKMIRVIGVELYESFKRNYQDAMDAVKSDNATLMDEAREIKIDLDH